MRNLVDSAGSFVWAKPAASLVHTAYRPAVDWLGSDWQAAIRSGQPSLQICLAQEQSLCRCGIGSFGGLCSQLLRLDGLHHNTLSYMHKQLHSVPILSAC